MINKSEARAIFIKAVQDNYNNRETDIFDEDIVQTIFTLEDILAIADSFWDGKDNSKNDNFKNIVGEIIERKNHD